MLKEKRRKSNKERESEKDVVLLVDRMKFQPPDLLSSYCYLIYILLVHFVCFGYGFVEFGLLFYDFVGLYFSNLECQGIYLRRDF